MCVGRGHRASSLLLQLLGQSVVRCHVSSTFVRLCRSTGLVVLLCVLTPVVESAAYLRFEDTTLLYPLPLPRSAEPGQTISRCQGSCSVNSECKCILFSHEGATCRQYSECHHASFSFNRTQDVFLKLPSGTPAQQAAYTCRSHQNAFVQPGASRSSAPMATGITECRLSCSVDPSCMCFVIRHVNGECSTRADCKPQHFLHEASYTLCTRLESRLKLLLGPTPAPAPVGAIWRPPTTTTTAMAGAGREQMTVQLLIENLDYHRLGREPAKSAALQWAVRTAIAHEAGGGVGAGDVEVVLYPGSVWVEATVTTPRGTSAAYLSERLRSSATFPLTLHQSVVSAVEDSEATTGDVGISGVTVSSVSLPVAIVVPQVMPTCQPTVSLLVAAGCFAFAALLDCYKDGAFKKYVGAPAEASITLLQNGSPGDGLD